MEPPPRTPNREPGTRNPEPAVVAASVPGAVIVFATAVMLGLAAAGRHPLWPHDRLTLPEAAALRDAGEVARLVATGADPNAAGTIRPRMLLDTTVTMTPLQAAVEAERAEIVSLLLSSGATPGDAEWTALVCQARSHSSEDIVTVLRAWRPGVDPACESR
jgi:hypothetical protein